MAVLNIAILATLLPAVLAVPHYGGYGGHMGHGPVKGHKLPSGFPTGFPHPSGIPGGPHHPPHHPSGAPFPAPGNGTSGGPTGSGTVFPISTGVSASASSSPESAASGPVTIQSTLLIIPQPVSSPTGGESPASTGAPGGGQSPVTGGSGGSSPSSVPGSGASPSSAPGSGPGSGGETGVCGPATVTITMANTVTVTVPASAAPESGSPESQSPIESQPASPSTIAASPSTVAAPYPISNSSMPAGPTGTGTGIGSSSALPVYSASMSPITSVVAATSTLAAPIVVPVFSTSAPAVAEAATQTSTTPVAEAPAQTSTTPAAETPAQTSTTPAAEDQQATTAAPAPSVAPVSDTNSPAQVSSSPAQVVSTSAAPQTSTTKSSSGVKARGLLYGSLPAAQAFDMSSIGWCWDWDSSVTPSSGQNVGSIGCDFVPQLLSDASVHTSIWSGNAAGASYVMGFNEPDNCGGGGACMSVTQAVASWGTYLNGMEAALVSPATTNDLVTKNTGYDYMTQFLAQCHGCKFQALSFHWYGNSWDINDTPGGLEPTIKAYQKLQQQYNIPELWIPEMAPNQAPTQDQMTALLAYLDSSAVTRYAFNGLDTGTGQQLSGMLADCYTS